MGSACINLYTTLSNLTNIYIKRIILLNITRHFKKYNFIIYFAIFIVDKL